MAEALRLLQHRGPDDSDIWSGDSTAIGHCRLSIIDLGGSRQPMRDPSCRYVLTYNGEIYNYKFVRESLKGKWEFITEGDTEVLLAGLIIEGISFLDRLEGMWAFAFWDDAAKSLILARDRMGKKPLYYYTDNRSFYCASELAALRTITDCLLEEDLDSTADYLRYGYFLPGTTAYKNIKEILPGHTIKWNPGTAPQQNKFWQCDFRPFNGSRQKAYEEIENLLTDAARVRLVADVEVGAFLSGGIDSSLLVGLLTRNLNTQLKTFTIGFKDQSFDESAFAREVAEYFNTSHHEEKLKKLDANDLVDLVLKNCGQPFADSSLLPTALVSRAASKKVKVAISGDGADELFSGYQRYQARSLMRWYTRVPKKLRSSAYRMIRRMGEPSAHHSRSIIKKAHLFMDIVDNSVGVTPYVAPLLYSSDQFRKLCPELEQRGHKPPCLPDQCDIEDIGYMMKMDSLVYLPQDILVKVDRASMKYSLETRAPFLDSRVVSMALSLPDSWHRNFFSGKQVLKNAFCGLLPRKVWQRRKQGFSVPVYQWLKGKLHYEIQELLESLQVPLEGSFVNSTLLAESFGGFRDHSHRLWSIYVYLKWKEQFG